MKKIIIIVAILSICTKGVSQTPDPVLNSIMQLNFQNYATMPVDSFLNAIPQSYNYIKIIGHTFNNKARYLAIHYAGGTEITISPKNYTHMNRIDPNRIWNLPLFRQETSFYISVTHRQSYTGKEATAD